MITIRELAARHGLTLRALRFYEDRGLIHPQREGRTRLYSEVDAARVAMSLAAKALGFTLFEVPVLIRERGGMPLLCISPADARAQLALMRARRSEIEAAIGILRGLAQETQPDVILPADRSV